MNIPRHHESIIIQTQPYLRHPDPLVRSHADWAIRYLRDANRRAESALRDNKLFWATEYLHRLDLRLRWLGESS